MNDEPTSRYKTIAFTPIVLRRELFKLFYLSDLFNLNEKADASEAYHHLLEVLHASMCVSCGQKQSPHDQ